MRIFLLLLLFVFVLSGCATAHHTLNLSSDFAVHKTKTKCNILFTGIKDSRRSKIIYGPAGNTYDMPDFLELLDAKIAALTELNAESSEQSELLSLELIHVHAQGQAMMGYFNVVLEAKIDQSHPKIIRGRHRSTTMFGSASEFQSDIKNTLDNTIEVLYDWLHSQNVCV